MVRSRGRGGPGTGSCAVLLGILLLVGASPGACDDSGRVPELPAEVWSRLLRGDGTVLVGNWPQLRGLPEVELARLALGDGQADDLPEVPWMGPILQGIQLLEPVEEAVLGIWVLDADLMGMGGSRLIVETSLSSEEILERYRASGWWDGPGNGEGEDDDDMEEKLFPPLDEASRRKVKELAEMFREQQELLQEMREEEDSGGDGEGDGLPKLLEEDPERWAILRVAASKGAVVVGEGGWLGTGPTYARLSPGPLERPGEAELEEGLGFPCETLVDPPRHWLFLVAVAFPGEDREDGEDGESVPEEEEDPERAALREEISGLYRELQALGSTTLQEFWSRTGNMLVVVDEVDGGVVLDLDAELPLGPEESFTPEVVRMGLGFARMGVAARSPELARELLRTSVTVEGDRVRAVATLSHASILEWMEASVAAGRRRREILKRLDELEELFFQMDDGEPGAPDLP